MITKESEEMNELVEQEIKLLSAWEVALILGLGESTVRELARDGELGYVQLKPSRRRFTYELVREFIESHTVRASKPKIPLDFSKSLEEWGVNPEDQGEGHE